MDKELENFLNSSHGKEALKIAKNLLDKHKKAEINKKLKDLYYETLEYKWYPIQKDFKNILENYRNDKIDDISYVLNNLDQEIFSKCCFCKETLKSKKTIFISFDGNNCKNVCLIDKDICGSKNCLLSQLNEYIKDIQLEKIEQTIDKIIEKIKFYI